MSKLLVNTPVTPNSYNGLSRTWSPIESILIILVLCPKFSSCLATVFACQSANSLDLVPILIISV